MSRNPRKPASTLRASQTPDKGKRASPDALQDVERQLEQLLDHSLKTLERAFTDYPDLKFAAQCKVLLTCGEIQEIVDKHYDPMANFQRQEMLNLGIERGEINH